SDGALQLRSVLLGLRGVRIGVVFFFQAEDGIRDFHVTGVQTCALPIFAPMPALDLWTWLTIPAIGAVIGWSTNWLAVKMIFRPRSEERRVGKEGRSRWAASD